MRKFTLFVSSLLLCMSAMAQSYSVSETKISSSELNTMTESALIAIKNLSRTNNYWFVGNSGAVPYSVATFSNDAVFVWEPVTEGTAGSYYLKKLDNTYMQASSPKDFGTIDNAAVFTTTNPTVGGEGSANFNGDTDSQDYIDNDNANLVRFVVGNKWINVQNGDSGTPLYNAGIGGWTIHFAYKVDEVNAEDLVEITYSFKLGDVEKYTQTSSVVKGEAFPDYNVSLPYGVTAAAKPEGVVSESGIHDIALTAGALPFEAAADVNSITTWYYAKMHTTADYTKYIQALEDNTIEWADTEVKEDEEDSYLWGFVGDAFGLKVVNKGTDKAIVSTSGDATLGAKESATAFVVTVSATGVEGGFCLQYPGTSSWLNGQQGVVKTWTSNDAGSTFMLEEYVADSDIDTAIERINAQQSAVVYDLTGRRVQNVEKGIYIVNGRKVVIK